MFTSGATAALKLVGECFSWSSGSVCCLLYENHNAAVGIREYALKEGASVVSVYSADDFIEKVAKPALVSSPNSHHLLISPCYDL